MNVSKKIKTLSALALVSFGLTGCSNTQMAVTGLALAGTIAAVGAYGWINNPDAETALDQKSTTVFLAVKNVVEANSNYTVTSTKVGTKQSQLVLVANNKEVKIVVEDIGNNQTKIYINDGRGKDQAQILLNKIIKAIK
jgi:hypothetical protein